MPNPGQIAADCGFSRVAELGAGWGMIFRPGTVAAIFAAMPGAGRDKE